MKALIKVLFVTVLASVAVVGCGDKDSGNNNNQLLNGFTPFGASAGGDQFRGQVNITDNNLYQQYLEDSRLCADLFGVFGGPSTCKWIDNAPFIAIAFQSREYNASWGLPASVVFDVVTSFNNQQRNNNSCHQYNPGQGQWTGYQQFPQVGSQGCNVSFYNINENTQLEATMYTISGQIQIALAGAPADNQVVIELRYRGRAMGTATLTRIPTYNYLQQPYNPYQQQQPYNPYQQQQPYNPYQPYNNPYRTGW